MSSIWSLYNLTRSPFQRRIAPVMPLELVVGREAVVEAIFGPVAAGTASIQQIEGAAGVGRSTTIEALCDVAVRAGAVAPPVPVRLTGAETVESIWLACLRATYAGIVGQAGPDIVDSEAVLNARGFLQLARIHAVDQTAGELPDWLEASIVVPELLAELMTTVRDQLGRLGVVIPIEWAVDTQADRTRLAAAIAAMWVHRPEGLHLVAADVPNGGMAEALLAAGAPCETHILAPLTRTQVWDALWRRAWFLREDRTRAVVLPISGEAVEMLIEHFAGDFTSLLQALEWASEELVGYGTPLDAPMSADEVRSVLAGRVRLVMNALQTPDMPPAVAGWLTASAAEGFRGQFTAGQIVGGPTAVPEQVPAPSGPGLAAALHRALATLQRGGCVRPVTRSATQPVYAWTGVARAAVPSPSAIG